MIVCYAIFTCRNYVLGITQGTIYTTLLFKIEKNVLSGLKYFFMVYKKSKY